MPLSFNTGISSKTLYFSPLHLKNDLSQASCPVHFSNAGQLQATSKEKNSQNSEARTIYVQHDF